MVKHLMCHYPGFAFSSVECSEDYLLRHLKESMEFLGYCHLLEDAKSLI